MAITYDMTLQPDGIWRHSFDTAQGGDGGVNGGLARADAFLTFMHDDGVAAEQVTVAVVVHEHAIADVLRPARREAAVGETDNPNAALVERITAAGGEVWVCARSAAAQGVGDGDLLPNVGFAPSAMIAHAELQRRGFSLNPY
jgi:intracellular sulfur oxidation DsrE/DsrF family protein